MRVKQLIILSVLFFVSSLSVLSQELESITFEELYAKTEKKPILVFLTADWCTYCESMKNTSFRNKEVIKEIKKGFYFVEFDIESKEDIKLGSAVFKYKPSGLKTGTHELAEIIGTIDGVLNTPTIVLLNKEMEVVYQYGGYMDTEQLTRLLKSI